MDFNINVVMGIETTKVRMGIICNLGKANISVCTEEMFYAATLIFELPLAYIIVVIKNSFI